MWPVFRLNANGRPQFTSCSYSIVEPFFPLFMKRFAMTHFCFQYAATPHHTPRPTDPSQSFRHMLATHRATITICFTASRPHALPESLKRWTPDVLDGPYRSSRVLPHRRGSQSVAQSETCHTTVVDGCGSRRPSTTLRWQISTYTHVPFHASQSR